MTAQPKDITSEDVDTIERFISSTIRDAGADGAVVGISGGLDSAVVAKLCADAIGSKNVHCVFIPSTTTNPDDDGCTERLCSLWGIRRSSFDISAPVNGLAEILGSDGKDPMDKGNISSRLRMTILFHCARHDNYIVMGTSNLSEIMTGYFTKYGDGASDASPIAGLYKTQVRKVAEIIGVPRAIIDKVPTAGLWAGQTDEDEFGMTYAQLDSVLVCINEGLEDADIADAVRVPRDKVAGIRARVVSSAHKRNPIPIPRNLY